MARHYAIMAILALALLLRTWGAFDNPGYFEDEALHVPAAIQLGEYGTTAGTNWVHPHLSHLLLYGSIKLFGDNPYGWRMKNVVLGTLTVGVLFLIALELFPGTPIPLLAATLLAVDPLHIYYSRTTYMEIPVTCFFLLFLWFVLRHLRTGHDLLIPAGISLGLTMATKSYYPFAIILTIGMVIHHYWKQRESSPALWTYLAEALLLLPASIYLLSYLPWLGNGRTFFELFQMKQDAFKALQSFSYDSFVNIEWLKAGGMPWEWFLKPAVVCISSAGNGVIGTYLMEIHNPPIHLLTFPALLACVLTARRKRQWNLLIIPALFLSTYLVFVLVRRPIFSYSANVVLPFACLMIACAVNMLAEKVRSGTRIMTVILVAIILWGLYLFPLTSQRMVPTWLYRPILSLATYVPPPRSETMSPSRQP